MHANDTTSALEIGLSGLFSFRDMPERLVALSDEFDATREEGEQAKCVYALYGLAMYHGQVFEQGVGNVLLLIDVLTRGRKLDLGAPPIGLSKKNTLGQLISKITDRVTIDKQADKLIRVALRRRNFLAHGFFARRVEWMHHTVGLRWMATELLRSIHIFQSADFLFEPLCRMLLSLGGCSSQHLAEVTQRMQQSALARFEAVSR